MTEPYLRAPAVNGDRLAFVCDDDLWVGSVDGGDAWRLTAAHAAPRRPRWSPSGQRLAWTSTAAGPAELWVAEPEGDTTPRRLTWWGEQETWALGWDGEDAVIVASATGAPFGSETWAWSVPWDGGAPTRLPWGPVSAWAPHRGALLLGADQHSYGGGAAWKRYRGGTAAKVWIDRDGSGTFERFGADLDGQLEDPQWCGDRVVVVSDHEGWGNLYSLTPEGTDLRRHTDHDGVYAREATGDGTRIAYRCAGDLWLLDSLQPDSQPRRLTPRLRSGRTGRTRRAVDVPADLVRVVPDAAGQASALTVRGAAVWLPHRDGPARVLHPGGASRARLVTPAGTGVAWVDDADDADGADTLVVAEAPAAAPRRLETGTLGRVEDLAASPDGRWLATASHDGRVRITDTAGGATREVHRSGYGPASGLVASPDGRWLAWSAAGPGNPNDDDIRQVLVVEVDGGDPVELTPLRFRDSDPAWTADGRYLAFLSRRSFDPVYDQVRFDLAFPATVKPYLVRLRAGDPAPLAPSPGGRPLGPAAPEDADRAPGAAVQVTIDTDGLADRVEPLPVPAGRLDHLVATGAGLAWLDRPVAGELGDARATLTAEPAPAKVVHLDLATGAVTTRVEEADDLAVSGDGHWLLVRRKEALRAVPADRPAGEDAVDVDLSRIRLESDPEVEWPQMFDEAARLMRLRFWVEDMGGIDWDGAVERWRAAVDRVSTPDELWDVLWELHGELGTSHAYVLPKGAHEPPQPGVGALGADLRPDPAGGWRIERLPATEASVPAARSALRAAGAVEGDTLVAIDGRPVGPDGPGPLLLGAGGKVVELDLRDAGNAGTRRVAAVALVDDRSLRYHDWVAGRRAEVRRLGGGRVGYLHIPDMVSHGWAELHRDLRLESRFDGLLVDLRHNGGGHTSQLVLERLAAAVSAWEVMRDREAQTYPVDAPRGPMAALIDQYAGSDGDIGSSGFRSRGLGPLIGTRTWGGVIGIDGRYRLVDGTLVTQPAFSYWFAQEGWSVEGHGVDPDVEVALAPHDHAAGRDPQLEAGVAAILDALTRRPPATPPSTADRPDRRPPPLPSRPGAAGR